MKPDTISIISIKEIISGEEEKSANAGERSIVNFKGFISEEEEKGKNDKKQAKEDERKTSIISFLFIVLFCMLFAIPWTTIPRTNSIIYQGYWIETLLPGVTNVMLIAGLRNLDLTTWTKEESLSSFFNYFKIYLLILILIFPCLYIIFPIGLWFVLPSNLLKKEGFRGKLRIYMIYILWLLPTVVLREILSYLFAESPADLQFLVPFMVAGCRELDKRIRSKLVTKMMGVQDEPASALIAIYISTIYSTFIAIRLVGAQFSTVCCTIAIDFVLHSKMTYQIIKECRKINDTEIEIVNVEDNERITILVIAELVEGFTPVIYAMTITMAYYGPNSHLISDVGNTYWGEEIENIENLYVTMFLLFGIDTLSAIINSVCLWRLLYVDMLSEFCRVLKKYGFVIAIFLATSASLLLATKDINLGIDGSRSFKWISKDGWRNLVNDSRDLTNDEKYELLNKANLL